MLVMVLLVLVAKLALVQHLKLCAGPKELFVEKILMVQNIYGGHSRVATERMHACLVSLNFVIVHYWEGCMWS